MHLITQNRKDANYPDPFNGVKVCGRSLPPPPRHLLSNFEALPSAQMRCVHALKRLPAVPPDHRSSSYRSMWSFSGPLSRSWLST